MKEKVPQSVLVFERNDMRAAVEDVSIRAWCAYGRLGKWDGNADGPNRGYIWRVQCAKTSLNLQRKNRWHIRRTQAASGFYFCSTESRPMGDKLVAEVSLVSLHPGLINLYSFFP